MRSTPAAQVTATPAAPDLQAVKTRQRATWASGDYSVVGTTLQIVGERLCEALDLHAGETVLDVAAGNGNVSLAAARRFCDVVSTDYVPSLLERGRRRAEGEGLSIRFQEADAESLPFASDTFDAVTSSFGVMFTPDQEAAAAELLRVARPGGRIGLANWTPTGFIGQLLKTIGAFVPPPRASVHPWSGEQRTGSPNCFRETSGPSRSSRKRLRSGTRRRMHGSRSGAMCMGRCTRPSAPSTAARGPSSPTRCSNSSTPTTTLTMGPWSFAASTSRRS